MSTRRDPVRDPLPRLDPVSGTARHRLHVARRIARGALALGLVALMSGCLPIGARVSNMYAQAPAAPSAAR